MFYLVVFGGEAISSCFPRINPGPRVGNRTSRALGHHHEHLAPPRKRNSRALHFGAVYKGPIVPGSAPFLRFTWQRRWHLCLETRSCTGRESSSPVNVWSRTEQRTRCGQETGPGLTPSGLGPQRPALRNWAAAGHGVEALGFSLAGGTRVPTPAVVTA